MSDVCGASSTTSYITCICYCKTYHDTENYVQSRESLHSILLIRTKEIVAKFQMNIVHR